jgi:acetolactate synthase-1/3 small subunit
MTHTLVAMMRDRPAALNRAVSLFRRRGFAIEQLLVTRSEVPGVNRVTVDVDAENIDQLVEQLRRLIDVLTVRKVTRDVTSDSTGDRGAFSGPHHWQADGADDHGDD